MPVVFNCGGYESVETLMLLDGLVEIYMPDFKYADEAAGRKYSGVKEYLATATAALKEMYRQVGPLIKNAEGVAQKGMLVRHLVWIVHPAQKSVCCANTPVSVGLWVNE